MPWSSHSCNDRRYSYFARNICNRCFDSLKILFGATSEVCSAIVGDQASVTFFAVGIDGHLRDSLHIEGSGLNEACNNYYFKNEVKMELVNEMQSSVLARLCLVSIRS